MDLVDADQPGQHVQASLDIRTRLAAADPTNTEWQRDLSISHGKLGDVAVAVAAGDLTAAREHFVVDLRIAEELAAKDPSNARWTVDVEISRRRLAELEGHANESRP